MEFCSSRPVKIHGKYRFVRDVDRALVKFGWAPKFKGLPGSKRMMGYLYGKSLACMYEYAGVPLLGDFFTDYSVRLKRSGARFRITDLDVSYHLQQEIKMKELLYKDWSECYSDKSPEALNSFMLATGFDEAAIMQLRGLLNRIL